MPQNYLAYTRVSTAKQGEGVSLEVQRDAITRYAERQNIAIERWFEEKETAAKRGRPVFGEMLKLLGNGSARGVIIHKIDRSARNLKDWANLGELIDAGVEVHFANESLDLNSRGGRLSADIQAVVAADYIRNLREETRKGFYGRLKQGIYPLRAPLGYTNNGGGKAKTIDPVSGPLVRQAFEIYARGGTNLQNLATEMFSRGLRSQSGNRLGRTGLAKMLRNPFYIGMMRLRTTGERFTGVHESLVSRRTFERVQQVLDGKAKKGPGRHAFLFRRMFRCDLCGYSLIAERQKGHVYYRCHTRTCPMTGIREENLDRVVRAKMETLRFSPPEVRYLLEKVRDLRTRWKDDQETEKRALSLRLSGLKERLDRLTDAYLDQVIPKELYDERKEAVLQSRLDLEERLQNLSENSERKPDRLKDFLELAQSAYSCYKSGSPDEKRELLVLATSNRTVSDRNVKISLKAPFKMIATSNLWLQCGPSRARHRILDAVLAALGKYFKENELVLPEKEL